MRGDRVGKGAIWRVGGARIRVNILILGKIIQSQIMINTKPSNRTA